MDTTFVLVGLTDEVHIAECLEFAWIAEFAPAEDSRTIRKMRDNLFGEKLGSVFLMCKYMYMLHVVMPQTTRSSPW